MQRACAAALLSKGTTQLLAPGNSNDDLAALDVIARLGADIIHNTDGSLTITSNGIHPVTSELNCGESGLGIRMFTPIVALSSREITINGTGSLLGRPMSFFDEIFPQLGISIQSNQGKVPLIIKGPLQPMDIEVDGSLSSQFLTGLLMAFGAAGASDVCIRVKDLTSKPYIDLTLQVMKHFGVEVENNNYEQFCFRRKTDGYKATSYKVEGDWSGGAFLLVAGAIAGGITVTGLDVFSTQADRAILQALMHCGALLSVTPEKIEVSTAPLKAFHFNATECPDLFPPLVALASYCMGKTIIEGAKRLTHKESNRALTLQEEFSKMGIRIELQDDLMIVEGSTGVKGASIHSHHDHRIAMACAVAALQATGETIISEAEAVGKSYPDFYEHLRSLGSTIDKL